EAATPSAAAELRTRKSRRPIGKRESEPLDIGRFLLSRKNPGNARERVRAYQTAATTGTLPPPNENSGSTTRGEDSLQRDDGGQGDERHHVVVRQTAARDADHLRRHRREALVHRRLIDLSG